MTNAAAVRLIADNLAALTHPGSETTKPVVLPLPMFRSSGIPADQAEQFAQDAGLPHADINLLVAEAIVELLERNDLPPTPAAHIEQLQTKIAIHANQGDRDITFRCGGPDRSVLFTAPVRETAADEVTVSPHTLRVLQSLSPECALGHAPVVA